MSTRHSKKPAGKGKKAVPAAQGKDKVARSANSEISLPEDERRRMVAEAAYYRALQRGFTAGGEIDDWLAAEREISHRLAASDAARATHDSRKIGPLASAKPDGAGLRTRSSH